MGTDLDLFRAKLLRTPVLVYVIVYPFLPLDLVHDFHPARLNGYLPHLELNSFKSVFLSFWVHCSLKGQVTQSNLRILVY